MVDKLSLSEIAEAVDILADLMANEQVEEFAGQSEAFWRDAAAVIRSHVVPRDDDWVVLSTRILQADLEGKIQGFQPGQLLVNLTYILAQVGLKEVVEAMIAAGRARGLSAFDAGETTEDTNLNGKGH